MPIGDILLIVQWWFVLFTVGLLFLPITSLIFPSFYDKGYIFAKVLGIIFISYLTFILGVTNIFSFTRINTIVVAVIAFTLSFIVFAGQRKEPLRKNLQWKLPIFLLEEFLFFVGLVFWSYVRGHQPDIQGLEKFMDYGFVNSILQSEYFPPKDMWFTPFPINYYYFGHFLTAVLTKLSGIDSAVTYNLMIATLFSFTFTCAFSIGLNFFTSIRSAIFTGFLCAILTSLAGNIHTMYTLFTSYSTDNPLPFWQLLFSPQTFPNSYWYPNATRFIYNTIHEFPIYSFVVSDLHGHVSDIPIVLTIIALLFSVFKGNKPVSLPILLLVSFLLASAYMTNAWDGLIYFLLAAIVIFFLSAHQPLAGSKKTRGLIENYKFKMYSYVLSVLPLGFGLFIFSLPFSLNFKPFVSGIGVLCAPKFLTDIGKLGPFLFEADHCQHSPLWQMLILYGFFYFFVFSFFYFLHRQKTKTHTDIFVFILIFLSTLLILIPELIYVKDIYPAHYRANTMFKLVYQSFMMLSLACGYIIIRLSSNIKNQISKMHRKNQIYISYVYLLFNILFFILVMIYPVFAISSYYGNLQQYQGLNGLSYLKRLYPSDYQAILWLKQNVSGQPVILEAQGDSYTDYGRVSTNTGLPTVLGWTVHEWLWRGSYDIPAPRIADVQTLYESEDFAKTQTLINKYNIQYVFIGDLERKKYTVLNEGKFRTLGTLLYINGMTKIYKLTE